MQALCLKSPIRHERADSAGAQGRQSHSSDGREISFPPTQHLQIHVEGSKLREEGVEGERRAREERSKREARAYLHNWLLLLWGVSEKTQSLTRRVAGSNLSLSTYRRQNLPTRPEADEP